MVVSAVVPNEGTDHDRVVIEGSGFASPAAVRFKHDPARSVEVKSSTRIEATPPPRLLDESDSDDDGKTVDVTVTVGVATSPTSPNDEFTYVL
ncbi:hypothetical protein ACFV7Q_12330 [Streptomyces sp. NPDC059851]|uniref:hypothetical protein n=1 Tax=Streptomyces sp. NPDC059851 TaxID=3346971 RepID=UPI003647AF83